MTTTSFTAANAADELIRIFGMLRANAVQFDKWNAFFGGQFNEYDYKPDDFKLLTEPEWRGTRYIVNLGKEFSAEMYYDTVHHVQLLHPSSITSRMAVYFDGAWVGRVSFRVDPATNTVTQRDVPYVVDTFWADMYAQLKKKASITLREHKKYLASVMLYDTLERELEIKQRPKKKK